MKDVAAIAGVSPIVVSKVLHNKASTVRVSEATAERVRSAAKLLGYRVNVYARNFRERQTRMIGVLHGIGFPRLTFSHGSRYFAALMDGVVEGAFAHGYAVTLCPELLGSSPEDAMSDGRFDGLVWYSTFTSDENRRMLEQCSVPLVLIHTPAAELDNRFPTVICDNELGIRLAMEHLYELGHRRIGFAFNRDALFGEAVIRRDAFLRISGELGLETTSNCIVDACGIEDVDRFLQSKHGLTAVVTENEGLGAIMLNQARKHGVRVPDDLSVVGFDSTSFCEEQQPPLTAISQPLVNIGARAIDLLVQSIGGSIHEHPEVILPCGLNVRGSTSAPNHR